MTSDKTFEKTSLIIIASIFMSIAAVLRFPGIGEQSLWIDEVRSLNLSAWPVGIILTVEDGLPPLYVVIMKAFKDS